MDPGGLWQVGWEGEMIIEIVMWRQELCVRIVDMIRDVSNQS